MQVKKKNPNGSDEGVGERSAGAPASRIIGAVNSAVKCSILI
jgi:hypothetical protein